MLVGIGAVLGAGAGTLSPVPDLLRDWLVAPVETTVLSADEEPPAPVRLEAFRALQAPVDGPARMRAPRGPDVAAPPPRRRETQGSAFSRALARIVEQVGRAPETLVQVASYRDLEDADSLAERLVADGFDAFVGDSSGAKDRRHRVRVRPAGDQQAAALARVLRERGFRVWVTAE